MATIGKTFSDPDKWEQAWFSSLKPSHKLLFTYLWERCDHAGVIEIVPLIWGAHIGQQITAENVEEFTRAVNQSGERLLSINGKLWFTEYIRFNQQSDKTKPLSPDYSFHRHVYGRIIKHGIEKEIKKRDQILLKSFDEVSNQETAPLKPSPSLPQALPKSTGKVSGKGLVIEGEREQEANPSNGYNPRSKTSLEKEMEEKGELDELPF